MLSTIYAEHLAKDVIWLSIVKSNYNLQIYPFGAMQNSFVTFPPPSKIKWCTSQHKAFLDRP